MNSLEYFKQICSMPHGSGNEKQISDWLVCFAKEHNLAYEQDEKNNVIIYKDGVGDPVILQAHMDMVCVKTSDNEKDMSKEGLDIIEDENFLYADRTSLGADDGIGVAMILSILEDDDLKHPKVEAVFTISEETGMDGAVSLNADKLKAKRLINLDSEEEGKITVGCAGGSRLSIFVPCLREPLNNNEVCYEVAISGLLGGHSGTSITLHRANAIRLLARLFYGLSLKMEVKLCEFEGGIVENAIPSSARAIVAISKDSIEDFERLTSKHELLYKKEYENEKGLDLSFDKLAKPMESAVVPSITKDICRMISSIPDGLRKESEDFPSIAQTSSNIGVVSLKMDGIHAEDLVRSSVPDEKQEVVDIITKMVNHDGGTVSINSEYPAWPYRKDSTLRNVASETYYKLTGHVPEVTITHGGLEVGYFESKIEDLDSIAIGPNIMDIHSPNEKLEKGSALRTYKWLVEMLKNL